MTYFATGSDFLGEHENMKETLSSMQFPFEEELETWRERRIGVLRPHKVVEKVGRIFASTNRRDVIDSILNGYSSWHSFSWRFPFVVAESEPPSLRSFLRSFSPWKGQINLPLSIIENSYCIVVTAFEHGLELLSDKISYSKVLEVATKLAAQYSMDLLVENLDRVYHNFEC